ncbi:hypothetical protein [Achromobacter insolitus]|uniref:hypothetical protein n=1 Tax=Achromobacter insolitus TaxID=217204 RepID=UPI0028B1485F|nr:hypothetical protein [Achromobacter insolitus]
MIDWGQVESAAAQLAKMKASQRERVEAEFGLRSVKIVAAGAPVDRLMWPLQQFEALAWQQSATAETPYLDGLAAAQGKDPAEVRSAALARVLTLMSESQDLAATRQRLLDAIEAAQTVDEVTSVVWQ